jgi:hypothetical protein
MTQQYPVLTIDGSVAGQSTTGVFEFESADVEPFIRTGELFKSSDGPLQTLRARAFGSRRDEVQIDGGAGVTAFRIDFDGWEGSDGQWGDSSANQLTQTSATGQPPISQISVLLKYLEDINIGSGNPAKFEWGEFADSGIYSAFDVAFEEPSLPKSRDESSSFSGSISLISVADISDALDRVAALG